MKFEIEIVEPPSGRIFAVLREESESTIIDSGLPSRKDMLRNLFTEIGLAMHRRFDSETAVHFKKTENGMAVIDTTKTH